MAPIATADVADLTSATAAVDLAGLKKKVLYDPLSATLNLKSSENDDPSYPYNDLKPTFPEVDWPPLEPFDISDRGLQAPSFQLGTKGNRGNTVLEKAKSWRWITPALGVEIEGLDIKQLTDAEKDDLALLGAQVGVIVLRDQHDLNIDDQKKFGAYFGPLHKHATTAVPRRGDLDDVHLVYADHRSVIDTTAFAKEELYHSDVTYELQPPGLTSLYLVAQPEVGGDTIFSSGYALYSSFSRPFQLYLESLSAVHSGVAQANGSKAAGNHVRRAPVETVHPVVRVHPVTGLKSIFVDAGFTRRIVGIPKAESDAVLALLFRGFAASADFQVRARWQPGTLVLWDNRIVTHSALFDFYPALRHGVRVTPQGEKPLSVAEYEAKFGKPAKSWAEERAKDLGVALPELSSDSGRVAERGFKD